MHAVHSSCKLPDQCHWRPAPRRSALASTKVIRLPWRRTYTSLQEMHSASTDAQVLTNFLQQDGDLVQDPEVLKQIRPKRIAIFVEPSPFTYVCGYKNRFCTAIKYLVESGCQVLVITTGKGFTKPGVDASAMVDQPAEFHGAKVVGAMSFGCPWYWPLPLSFALSPRIYYELKNFQPDLIHCSSPGCMVLAVRLYAWLLRLPLVLSYHTHVPEFLPKYKQPWLVPAMWWFLRLVHWSAHLTLVTSNMMKDELVNNNAAKAENIHVWKKGVDSEAFHPRYRSEKMRARMTNGHPEDPILVYVGRLGAEKNLKFLKGVLLKNPRARLAFVGDGPARGDLERHFRGTKTVFMGMMHGEELSSAFASADIFMMPSESETLGFVVLEAMASGLPVVAVRAGGIPDIITRHGEVGFLYDSEDLDRANQLVQQLLDSTELREQVGARAREEVSKWDWKAATMHLLNVQYPLAVAAAAAVWGPKLGSLARKVVGSQPTPGGSAAGGLGGSGGYANVVT